MYVLWVPRKHHHQLTLVVHPRTPAQPREGENALQGEGQKGRRGT